MLRNLNLKPGLLLLLLLIVTAVTPLLAASISGTVTNDEAQPIDHSSVQLYKVTANASVPMAYRSTMTAENGDYTFPNLPGGNYFVYAQAHDYTRGFYANPDGQIQIVEIDADDQEVVGIDIQLFPDNDPPPPHEFGAVSGRVLNQDNFGVPNVIVGIVTSADVNTPLPNFISHTSMNGSYMLNGIQAGTYKTCVLQNNLPIAWSAEFSVTANSMVDNVNIQIEGTTPPITQYGNISGNVIGPQASPMMMYGVRLVTVADPTVLLPNLYGHAGFDGHYYINHIPVGEYKACVVGEDMAILAYSAPVTIIANQTVENVDIIFGTLVGFGISGNIYNSLNEPVTNGVVELRSVAEDTNNHMDGHHTHRTVHPDSLGHYEFINVPAGQYYVSIWSMMSPVVFYPGVYDIAQASIVVVNDADVSGINITIPAAQNYSISGYVFDADTDLPLAGIKVRTDRMGFHHFPVHDSLFYNEYHAITDANGFYTLTLPVGRYTLAAVDTTHYYRIQFFDHANMPFQATIILLDENMANVNFDLIPRADSLQCSISGSITENGAAITYPVTVVAVSSDEDWEESTVSGNDGTYTISHIRPGSYYVMAYTLTNAPIFYDNQLTVENADNVIVHGPVTGIDFDLTNTDADGPSNLNGVITTCNGLAVDNVMVLLTDSQSQVLGFARTDENGNYTISNVPSQAYTVVTMKIGFATTTQDINLTGSQNLNLILNAPTANDDAIVPVISSKVVNYPNPFNPNTTISFATAKDTNVNISIYNIKGQCIKNLSTGNLKAGSHNLNWDGTDDSGKTVTSGIYLVKLQGEGFLQSHKMTLMK